MFLGIRQFVAQTRGIYLLYIYLHWLRIQMDISWNKNPSVQPMGRVQGHLLKINAFFRSQRFLAKWEPQFENVTVLYFTDHAYTNPPVLIYLRNTTGLLRFC